MKVNLGCGPHKLPGWENFDLEYGHDLRNGIPLPSNCADLVWSEHFIEHLTLEQGIRLLTEVSKILKPGGRVIISTPSLEYLCHAYNMATTDYYAKIRDVWNPASPCDMLNEGMRSWGHLYLYDYSKLKSILTSIGFIEYSTTERPEYAVRPFCGDLIVTARRAP